MSQLALDVFAGSRVRRGWWPPEAHQRGWVRLPYTTAGGQQAGTIVPAWVCCHCGGVEIGEYPFEIDHGCCRRVVGCVVLARQAAHGPASPPPERRFEAHWLPERPP